MSMTLSITRRSLLRSVAGSAALLPASGVAAPFLFRFAGSGAPSAGIVHLSNLTLANTSGSTQPAGVPTPIFGWLFPDGDIAVGTAPQFLVGGSAVPFSAGLQTYWPSGCLKFAAFMLLPGFSISGNGSQVVQIWNGGSWPPSSSRTLAEVYNQNLIVNCPLYPIASNGRGGGSPTIVSQLNGGSNQLKVLKWLDGNAGTAWKLSYSMTNAGTPDGMLVCDHYVVGLNNGGGTLGGFRWMGMLRSPYYNQSGKANNAQSLIVMAPPSVANPSAGVNFSIQPGGSGPITTTPLPWLGSDGNTFQAANFFYPGDGSNVCTTGTSPNAANNNWYMGAGGYQMLPVVWSNLTASFSPQLPYGSSVANGGYAFIGTNPSTGTTQLQQFLVFYVGAGFDQVTNLGSTAFSGTATPVPIVTPFLRLPFATGGGAYFSFQGSGSIASDTTLLVQIDQHYWIKSKALPPWNTSVTGGSFGGVIVPQTYNPISSVPNSGWFPYSFGPMTQNQPGTGDALFIGMVSAYDMMDFYNQTQNSLFLSRVTGLYGGNAAADFKDATTGFDLNLGNAAVNYQLPVAANGLNYNISTPFAGGGFTMPGQGITNIGPGLSLGEHEPTWSLWAYLRTGELQFLDMLVGQSQNSALVSGFQNHGTNNLCTPSGAQTAGTYYGTSFGGSNEMRALAWSHKDREWAAMFYPIDKSNSPSNPVFTDGSNLAQYLNALADDEASWPLDQVNNSSFLNASTYFKTVKPWFPVFNQQAFGEPPPSIGVSGGYWQYADFCQAMCLAAARGNANARTFLQQVALVELENWRKTYGLWPVYANGNRLFYPQSKNGTGQQALGLIVDNAHLYATGNDTIWNANTNSGRGYILWGPNNGGSTNAFTVHNITFPVNDYTLAIGDVFSANTAFDGAQFGNPAGTQWWPTEFLIDQPYYVVGLTTVGGVTTFNVSASPNGAPLAITSSTPSGFPGSLAFIWRPVTSPPLNAGYVMTNVAQFMAWWLWATALGIPGYGNLNDGSENSLVGDGFFRLANTPGTSIGYPSYQPIVSGQPQIDPRYCYQPIFG